MPNVLAYLKTILRRDAFRSAEVRPGRSSECGAEHFNKSAHALITDRDCHVGYRFMLRKPFKRGKQSRLLPPTAKRHAHFRGKSAHKRTPSHARFFGPLIQRTLVCHILEQSPRHFA